MPVFGVRWLTPPTEIAILTVKNTKRHFEAQLFHFGNNDRKMSAEFFNLETGNYDMYLGDTIISKPVISDKNKSVDVILPSQQLVILRMIKA
jgi:hypothetical protein